MRHAFLFCLLFLAALTNTATAKVLLGIDVLEQMDFKPLAGFRVGLLTHAAGVNGEGVPTIDVLRNAPNVNLVALYGPEHGVDGTAKAEKYVASGIHPRTGLPVYSLYGPTREPTPEMLKPIDIMVIDLQDIGVRSYTYVSAMKKTIEGCFKAGIPVMVLDRPNPLGGLKVDGPPLDTHLMSYVGAFRVPYVHGLTIGELAKMSKLVPGWLEVSDKQRRDGKLYVVPMKGWQRNMRWPDTGLRWVPTSPAIPDLSAVLGYAMTGLGCQLGDFRHGYGTPFPFRLITYPGKEPQALARILDSQGIAGLKFQPVRGIDKNGRDYRGVYVVVENWDILLPTELSFQMMRLACQFEYPENPFRDASDQQKLLFNKHVGSERWWTEISGRGKTAHVERFVKQWSAEAQAFQESCKPFWMYQ